MFSGINLILLYNAVTAVRRKSFKWSEEETLPNKPLLNIYNEDSKISSGKCVRRDILCHIEHKNWAQMKLIKKISKFDSQVGVKKEMWGNDKIQVASIETGQKENAFTQKPFINHENENFRGQSSCMYNESHLI